MWGTSVVPHWFLGGAERPDGGCDGARGGSAPGGGAHGARARGDAAERGGECGVRSGVAGAGGAGAAAAPGGGAVGRPSGGRWVDCVSAAV